MRIGMPIIILFLVFPFEINAQEKEWIFKKDSEEIDENYYCPICYIIIGTESDMCPDCGVEFEELHEEYECPDCGTDIGMEIDICPKCGTEFEE